MCNGIIDGLNLKLEWKVQLLMIWLFQRHKGTFNFLLFKMESVLMCCVINVQNSLLHYYWIRMFSSPTSMQNSKVDNLCLSSSILTKRFQLTNMRTSRIRNWIKLQSYMITIMATALFIVLMKQNWTKMFTSQESSELDYVIQCPLIWSQSNWSNWYHLKLSWESIQ